MGQAASAFPQRVSGCFPVASKPEVVQSLGTREVVAIRIHDPCALDPIGYSNSSPGPFMNLNIYDVGTPWRSFKTHRSHLYTGRPSLAVQCGPSPQTTHLSCPPRRWACASRPSPNTAL
jgi:hypothetical protein